jgi:hypothetical protein
MDKTKELQEPCLVLQKAKQALSSPKPHIGVFDDYEKGTDLTIQRFRLSNMFCKVMAPIPIAVECERPPASFPASIISNGVSLTY